MNGVDQIVDGHHAVFFRDSGKMCVTGGGFRAGMAEKGLNMPQA